MSSSPTTAKYAKSRRSHKTPRSDKSDEESRATSQQPDARGPNLKRLGLAGAALVVAGGAAFGIDQAVSPSSPTPTTVPSGGAVAQKGALATTYLAEAPNAVVSMDIVKAATSGYTGTATGLVQLGASTSRSDAALGYSIAATISGDKLEIGFNGGPKQSTKIRHGSFTITFPNTYGSPLSLTFNTSTVSAAAAAQQAFEARLAANPG